MTNHPFPRLGEFEDEIELAKQKYRLEMKRQFPAGALVRVNHHRGSFVANVVGHQAEEKRLVVENEKTGKRSYVYPSLRVGIHDHSTPCVEIIARV